MAIQNAKQLEGAGPLVNRRSMQVHHIDVARWDAGFDRCKCSTGQRDRSIEKRRLQLLSLGVGLRVGGVGEVFRDRSSKRRLLVLSSF